MSRFVHHLRQVIPALTTPGERTLRRHSVLNDSDDFVTLGHHCRFACEVQDLIGGQFQVNGDLHLLLPHKVSLIHVNEDRVNFETHLSRFTYHAFADVLQNFVCGFLRQGTDLGQLTQSELLALCWLPQIAWELFENAQLLSKE